MVELWCVMDSRANYDVDAATVLEAFTEKPSRRSLRRSWGQQDAVLVRMFGPSDKELNDHEIVCKI